MGPIEYAVLSSVILFVLSITIFACFGTLIASKRGCPNIGIFIYGTLLFFLVVLPLFIVGVDLSELSNTSNEKIQDYCFLTDNNNGHPDNSLMSKFFMVAHKFDRVQTNMLNKRMCTDVCPCLDYEVNGLYMKDLYSRYQKLLH